MTRIDDFLQPQRHIAPTAETRAAGVWVWINQHAVSLVVNRGGTAQTAQTVRIEGSKSVGGGASDRRGDVSLVVKRQVVVFGIRGHNSIADTDLRRGDRFSYNANPTGRLNYEIIHVDSNQLGQIQATAEEIQ